MTVRSAMTANQITAELLIEIPKRYPYIRVWRNNRIEATVTGRGGSPRHVSAGIDGQADICGIIGQSASPLTRHGLAGRMTQIEVKAGRDRMRPTQEAFKAMIESHGGIYLVARDVEGCLADLARVVGEG